MATKKKPVAKKATAKKSTAKAKPKTPAKKPTKKPTALGRKDAAVKKQTRKGWLEFYAVKLQRVKPAWMPVLLEDPTQTNRRI